MTELATKPLPGSRRPVAPRRALEKPTTSGGPNVASMAVAIAASLLALLDSTIVNVSLSDTVTQFGGIDEVQWVVTAYLLALAATMPMTGWLVSRLGVKRLFIGATLAFALGSLGCALSPTLGWLIVGRVAAGAAGGILTPTSTVLLTRGIPREQLGRVQALNGSVMLIGPLIGPTIGGLLVQWAGWPAIYAVNVPLCLLIVLAASLRVDADPAGQAGRRPLDVLGALAAVTWTVSAVMVIKLLAGGGPWTSPRTLAAIGCFLLGGTVFIRRELTTQAPLLDVRLYANRVYGWASLNVFFLGFILYGPMVIIPLYFQAARGLSAVATGLLLSTAGIGVVVSGLSSRAIVRRLGGGATMMVGISLTLVATIPLTLLTGDTSYVLLCGSLVVRGAGIGLTIVPAMTKAFESIPARSIPDASPQLNLLQRIGGAMAASLITVVLHGEAVRQHGLVPAAFAHACIWVLITSALTLVPAFALARAERRSN